ncbi:MAG: carboxymuconolactone decarboxylase family protein [Alphaproteobacteria bacterium]|nr:carboxymuconolactone decarboxylase family protein [Alphaproteobacteria bacterium]
MSDKPYPPDVHPESGCRLPPVDREALDDVGKEIYDAHVVPGQSSIAGLWGPGGIKLHSPGISRVTRDETHYFRHEAEFTPADREIAILITARECESQFEWTAHEPVALEAGVSQETIDVIKHRKPLDGVGEREAAIIQLGREIFIDRRVSAETYARALGQFGAGTLVDLVSLMGNYAGTAVLLCAFDMQVRPGKKPLLPTG